MQSSKFRVFVSAILGLGLLYVGVPQSMAAPNSISNITVNQSTVNAGGSVVVDFDVLLSDTTTTNYSYSAFITATTDSNGDGWTSQQWSGSAHLVSGDAINGHWSATIRIGGDAYTGNFLIGVGLPDKTFAATNLVALSINGSPMPTPLYTVAGTISNVTGVTNLLAGQSYDFTFDVSLTSTPSSAIIYFGGIQAASTDNGDPWNSDNWSNKASLISGNQTSGKWKVTIAIANTAVSGDYQLFIGQGVSKLILASGPLNLHIDGVAPTPKITPSYTFSNYSLASENVVKGSTYKASFHLLSNDPQVQTPECIIDGGSANWARATLKSGTNLDGNWECSGSVPSDLVAGTYDLHLAVVGYANNLKNEERVILKINVVNSLSDLQSNQSNNVYITTEDIAGNGALSVDTLPPALSALSAGSTLARIYIPPGVGTILAFSIGVGLLGTSNSISTAARAIQVTRSPSSGTNLYLISDGLKGQSLLSFTVSGVNSSKTVLIGVPVAVSPSPSPTATATPTPSPRTTQPSGVAQEGAKVPDTHGTSTPTPAPSSSVKPSPSPSVSKPAGSAVISPKNTPTPAEKVTPNASSTPTPSVSSRMITITCVKGKSVKQVKGLKPKCPTGYVKK